MRRSAVGVLVTVVLVTACASLRESFTTDPQAAARALPLSMPRGFSYDEKSGQLWVTADASDDLVVCVPPPLTRYTKRGPSCTELRDLRGYLYSTAKVEP